MYESNKPLIVSNDSSFINVSQCENILRNNLNIKENENITIINVESYKQERKENYNIEYYFYYNGKILNNNYCKDI